MKTAEYFKLPLLFAFFSMLFVFLHTTYLFGAGSSGSYIDYFSTKLVYIMLYRFISNFMVSSIIFVSINHDGFWRLNKRTVTLIFVMSLIFYISMMFYNRVNTKLFIHLTREDFPIITFDLLRMVHVLFSICLLFIIIRLMKPLFDRGSKLAFIEYKFINIPAFHAMLFAFFILILIRSYDLSPIAVERLRYVFNDSILDKKFMTEFFLAGYFFFIWLVTYLFTRFSFPDKLIKIHFARLLLSLVYCFIINGLVTFPILWIGIHIAFIRFSYLGSISDGMLFTLFIISLISYAIFAKLAIKFAFPKSKFSDEQVV